MLCSTPRNVLRIYALAKKKYTKDKHESRSVWWQFWMVVLWIWGIQQFAAWLIRHTIKNTVDACKIFYSKRPWSTTKIMSHWCKVTMCHSSLKVCVRLPQNKLIDANLLVHRSTEAEPKNSNHPGLCLVIEPNPVPLLLWHMATYISLADDEWRVPVYDLSQDTQLVEWPSMHSQHSQYHPCGPESDFVPVALPVRTHRSWSTEQRGYNRCLGSRPELRPEGLLAKLSLKCVICPLTWGLFLLLRPAFSRGLMISIGKIWNGVF